MQVSQEYRRMLHPASIQTALKCTSFDILTKSLNTDQLAPGNSLRGRLHFRHITVALPRLLIQRSQNLGSESLSSLQQEPSTSLTY